MARSGTDVAPRHTLSAVERRSMVLAALAVLLLHLVGWGGLMLLVAPAQLELGGVEGQVLGVAVGITAWLSIQAFMNIGAVIGIMPITGVPLPFISFGGSSLLINLAATGMLLNIARHPAEHTPRASRRAAR